MSKNRYQINKLLGKSRTGEVYDAEDKNLQRQVALRRFFDDENRGDFTQDKEEFITLAQSLSNLQHPNLLSVFDAGVDENGPYIVSQLLEGKSLHEEIKKGAMNVEELVELAKQMLDAFSVAHDIGYYHGALTADSILMTPRARGGYRYVILDMGLSQLARLTHGDKSALLAVADPAILAPELFDGAKADERADLYMLGQILFLCLAGTHPYKGLTFEESKSKHLEGLPSVKEYNKLLHKSIVVWLSKLTAVKPSDRPASAVEALNTLSDIPTSAFKTPAKLTETGLRPVFKGKSALSAIVESGPVKKMTTSLEERSSELPAIPVFKGTITKKSSYEETSSAVEEDPLQADSQEDITASKALMEEKQKLRLELTFGILALIVVGASIVFIIVASEDPSDFKDDIISDSVDARAIDTDVIE